MTDTKTFAQERLKNMLASYKEAKKYKSTNRTTSLKSNQQSGNVNGKKSSSIVKSSNKYDSSSSNAGMEIDSLKNAAVSQQSIKNCRPQSLNNRVNSLEKRLKQTVANKCLHDVTNPLPRNNKEAVLKATKNAKQFRCNGETEKHRENSYKTPEKRRLDHGNVEKKKISKNQKFEDSSKKVVNEKPKKEPCKASDVNSFRTKLSFIVDSYTTLGDDAQPSDKKAENSIEKCHNKGKEPHNNQRINIKFTIPLKKDTEPKVKEKEREIKDKPKMKTASLSSPLKTKLEARLQKVKADILERQKGTRKESSNEKLHYLPKSDNYNFIESMDWEPSNDIILRSIRDEVDASKEIMEWQDICDSNYNIIQDIGDNKLYIAVDTNVLLKNIELIKRLSKAVIRGFTVIQVIPWQVLKELDNLKTKVNYKNVNTSARKAIRFLSEATNNVQCNMVFQSQSKHFEECSAQFIVEVPDDHLIKCCYQLKQKSHKVLLLSNDVNLRIKTNTNNILAVDDKWIAKILDEESKPKKLSIHCFEKEPKDCQIDCDDNAFQFVHKTAEVILSSLYNIVSLKYKEKYGDLWPLWVPREPHFPDLTNFTTSSSYFQPYWIKLNSIKDFFIKNKSYEDTKPAGVEKLGRNYVSLVKSMCTDSFIPNDLALQIFNDLNFLKCFSIVDWSNCNYIEGSYRVAQKYLKDTEDSLNEFVAYIRALFAEKGSFLYRNEEVLRHIDLNLKLIEQFRSSILQFQLVQEQISEDSEAAKTLHKAICDFLGEKMDFSRFPIFSPEDIVEYVNPNRNIFVPALSWLMNQESSLTEIKSQLV